MKFANEEERLFATNTVAYMLWERAGKPEGKPEGQSDHFWFEAERLLNEKWHPPILFDDRGEYVWTRGPKVNFAPVLIDPDDYTPKRGILTRYGKKILDEGAKYYKKLTLRG